MAYEAGRRASGGHPLVEREHEVEVLRDTLAAARAGTGGIVLVEGPAGIGKSRLLEVARELAEPSMRLLHGRGTELERDYPMGVVRQCLEPAVRDAADRERLLTGAARLAEPVLLAAAGGSRAELAGILHGLFWLAAKLSEESPLLMVVDDAHWVDEPSLRYLAYLSRRVDSLPVALVVAARTGEESGGPAATVLSEMAAEPACELLDLRALGQTGLQRLLRELDPGVVDERFAAACHRATGGNPFLLGELLQALRADGVPFTAAGAQRVMDSTPPGIARAVSLTLRRAGPEVAALARAAAILGDGAAQELAAELAAMSAAAASTAALELVRIGLLDDAPALSFRHPILIGATRSGISARERAAMHSRAADLLRARGAPPERVALHLLHAAPAADGRVVDELRLAAGHAAGRGASETAQALLSRALAEPPAPELRSEVLFELGRAELAVGATAASAGHLEEAHRCAADPLTRGRAAALLPLANPGDAGLRTRIVGLVEETLPEVERRDRELALRLRAILVLEGAVTLADDLAGDTLGEAIVLGNLVFARMLPDATADEVAGIAERAAKQTDGLLAEGALSLAFTGVVLGLRWADRLESSSRLLDRAVADARRRGSVTDFGTAMTLRAAVHRRAGRLREAEADARSALEATLDREWFFARGIAPLIGTLLDRGRTDEALRELECALLVEDIPDSPPMIPVMLARMALHAARREHGRALADWDEAVRRVGRHGRQVNAGWLEDLAVVVDVHRATGDAAAAAASARQMLRLAERWGTRGAIGQALHAQARAGVGGDPVELLRRAVDELAESPVQLEHARALVALGGALRRQGGRRESREPLREGHELARRCGAQALAEAARTELRASGVRLRRDALTGADALTPSEQRIAGMAVAGLANAEIAQELFLTVKTVEMHLTHAYRKLDVPGRAGLAGALGVC